MKCKKLKSLFAFLLVLCMVFSTQVNPVFAQEHGTITVQEEGFDDVKSEDSINLSEMNTEETVFADSWEECDKCSIDNPHLISNAEELDKIRTHTHVEGDATTINGYFKLTNDIVFTDDDFKEGGAFYNDGHTWISIGQSEVLGIDGLGLVFCGKFNGDGYSIKNLKMTPNSDDKKLRYYCALFARLGNGGIITNTVFDKIENTTQHAPSVVVGTITGDNAELSNITIKDCVIAGGSHMPATFLGHELKGSVSNVIIQDSICGGDSSNANGGMIARAINNAKINNLTIKNCKYKYYSFSGLLCGSVDGDNTIEDIRITETEYALAHPNAGALVGTGNSANLFMKDVYLDFVYNAGLHGGLEEYDSYNVTSIPKNLQVTFDNVSLKYNLSGRKPTLARWWDAVDEMARGKGLVNLSCVDGDGNEAEVISYGDAYYVVKNSSEDEIKSTEFLIGVLNGGKLPEDMVGVDGTLVTPVKEGSVFGGWYDNVELDGDPASTYELGKTYYAKWIEEEPGNDKEDLAALIEYAQDAKKDETYKYLVPRVKELFEKALEDAIEVNNKEDATQAEVDAAYNELLAKVHLLNFTGNTERLTVLVATASGKVEEMYTKESWEPFDKALKAAQGVLADENALQAEIDVARDALQAAMDALVEKPIDTSKLEKLVADASVYEENLENYISSTAESFMAALDGARKVLASEKITQEAVDSAYKTLLNAIFGLREVPNKDRLEDLLGKVEAMDLSAYSEESANAVKAAAAMAATVMEDENANQEQVDAAVAALEEAVAALETKEEVSGDINNEGNDNTLTSDETEDTSREDDSSVTDKKVASNDGGSKDIANKTTKAKTGTKTAAQTGDAASAAVPAVAAAAALLAVWFIRKKK